MCGQDLCFNGLKFTYETNIMSFGEDDDGQWHFFLNFVWGCSVTISWMSLMIKAIGQRSRSPGGEFRAL